MEQNISLKRENFNAVDVAKFVLAFCVISIHTYCTFFENSALNSVIDGVIIRLAVPFFFVASGFFFFRDIVFENGRIKKCPENRAKLWKFLKRTLLLYSLWAVIYFAVEFYVYCRLGLSPVSLLKGYLTSFFLSGFSLQFWYIIFMVYAIVLLYVLLRFVRIEIVGAVSALFFLFFLYGYTYRSVFNTSFLSKTVKLLFTVSIKATGEVFVLYLLYPAVGFIFAGLMCVKLREKLSARVSGILTLVSLCLSVTENILIDIFLYKSAVSYTFFLLPTVFFGFIFLSKINLKGNRKVFEFLRNSSSFIYCFHGLALIIFNHFTKFKFSGTMSSFFIISAISLAAALIVVPLSRKVKFLRKLY